jgi:hypothetical protein
MSTEYWCNHTDRSTPKHSGINVSVPLCAQNIPHGLAWYRNPVSAVRWPQLTWTMSLPLWYSVTWLSPQHSPTESDSGSDKKLSAIGGTHVLVTVLAPAPCNISWRHVLLSAPRPTRCPLPPVCIQYSRTYPSPLDVSSVHEGVGSDLGWDFISPAWGFPWSSSVTRSKYRYSTSNRPRPPLPSKYDTAVFPPIRYIVVTQD